MDERLQAFKRLLDIMDRVREGCPWDSTQTLASLRHLTIEETYELSQAILNDNLDGHIGRPCNIRLYRQRP